MKSGTAPLPSLKAAKVIDQFRERIRKRRITLCHEVLEYGAIAYDRGMHRGSRHSNFTHWNVLHHSWRAHFRVCAAPKHVDSQSLAGVGAATRRGDHAVNFSRGIL